MLKNTNQEQSGRSMVEMLGVLAVIGVLSIAGIAGYTKAINKHKANEILNAASQRAMSVSAQIQSGSSATPDLGEFSGETVPGASFDSVSKSGTQFAFTVSGVDTTVCTEILNSISTNSNVNINTGCTTFTYNNDLSAPVTMTAAVTEPTLEEEKTVANCPSNSDEINNMESFGDVTTNIKSGGNYCACLEGYIWDGSVCIKASSLETCTQNSQCSSGEYCRFLSASNTSSGTGKCAKLAGIKKTSNNQFYYVDGFIDWFSAKNFCAALPGNHTMLKIETALASPFDCSIEDESCNTSYLSSIGLADIYWTDSCDGESSGCGNSDSYAYFVDVGGVDFARYGRGDRHSVLCE